MAGTSRYPGVRLSAPSYPRPNDRAGTLGVGTVRGRPAGRPSSGGRAPGFTAGQVAASLAANPQASSGGYGVGGPNNAAVGSPMMAEQGGGGGLDPYNYIDPILQKIQALSHAARANATADALALRKQLAISYGDTAGIPGLEGDTGTAGAASGNPFSILHELQRNYDRQVHSDEENLNQQGLFYSGARAKQLGLDAEEFQRQKAAALGTLQKSLGDVNSNLAQALMQADQQDIAGQTDAAGRATSRALQYGYDPGATSAPAPPAPPPAAPTGAPAPAAAHAEGAAIPTDGNLKPGSLAYALGLAHRRRSPYDLNREL